MKNTFRDSIDKVLRENKADEATQVLTEGAVVLPGKLGEKGEDVTHGVIDGTGKIDATGPIKGGAASTLKTNPGPTTSGPTGHIPQNSDLPKGQKTGLTEEDKTDKKKYKLDEEFPEDLKKDKKDVKEGELPPFIKKAKGEKDGDDKDKKDVKEAKDDKDVKEDKDADVGPDAGNARLGFTKKKKHVNEDTDADGNDKVEKKLTTEEADDKDDKKAVKEATEAILSGEENLSEAFKEKTTVLFEATLSKRIREYRETLNERFETTLNERVEQIREELTESVNGHLDLVVEAWVKENEVPLEKAIKAELVEDFIGGLKNLLEEHYIELPEEKVDVVAEMATRITNLEQKLNEQIETNVDLNKVVKLHERAEVFGKVSKGLVSTQVEKLKALSEGLEFKSASQYENALTILKETVDATPATQKEVVKETLSEAVLDQSVGETGSVSKQMTSVIAALARQAKK